jgi:type IV pilus modification protein PilV
MTRTSPQRFPATRPAFTLIEVLLAISCFAIGILAVLGLLHRALLSSRTANEEAVVATVAEDLFDSIRSQPFTAVDIGNGPRTLASAYTESVLFYDNDGHLTNAAGRQFAVTVKYTPLNPSLCAVHAICAWPARAAAPPHTNIFTTTIGRVQ